VRAAAGKVPAADADAWILGRGWDQNDWAVKEFPRKGTLDAAAPGRPVLLRRVDGHAAWLNGAALARVGITAQTPDPDGGRILRDASGEPTGILVDNAVDLATKVVPEPSQTERVRRLKVAMDHCLALGLTGVHDAGATQEQIADYHLLLSARELKLRLYVMLADDPATLEVWLPRGTQTSDGLLTVGAVKLYADGALGSRGALLLQDYSDDPGNRGLAVSTPEHLIDVARRAGHAGFQVCTHAIGDAANRRVLDVYEQVLGELKPGDRRWRIEHAQVLAPADIPRFARLGVIAAMQPVHCTSDMDWVPARLGEERSAGAYAWRSLLDSGAHLCFGTDFPVESADPLPGLYAARTRMHTDGTPAGGWHPEQCLTGREALALYTTGSAYAAFMEKRLGRIAPDCLADLTVLSGDPVAAPPAELRKMKALMTIVGGRVEYEAPRPGSR
jgi:predicted amidohydrolase YtcJ